MSEFTNTYIRTDHLSAGELRTLMKKYSTASGLPIIEGGIDANTWDYLTSVKSMGDSEYEPDCVITSEDSLNYLVRPKSSLTEITEEDLDEYLNNTSKSTVKYVEDWSTLEVGQKAVFRGFRNGHEHWQYCEGEVYTAYVDDLGSKGFMDATGDTPSSNYDNTFMFELIDEEPSTKITSDYPDYDFKISLKGMSDVEKELARDWLVEAAKVRGLGEGCLNSRYVPNIDYFFITKGMSFVTYVGNEDFDYYNNHKSSEIKLEFSTPTITGFSVDNSKKVLQLEEELATIRSQLKEREAELESLK